MGKAHLQFELVGNSCMSKLLVVGNPALLKSADRLINQCNTSPTTDPVAQNNIHQTKATNNYACKHRLLGWGVWRAVVGCEAMVGYEGLECTKFTRDNLALVGVTCICF